MDEPSPALHFTVLIICYTWMCVAIQKKRSLDTSAFITTVFYHINRTDLVSCSWHRCKVPERWRWWAAPPTSWSQTSPRSTARLRLTTPTCCSTWNSDATLFRWKCVNYSRYCLKRSMSVVWGGTSHSFLVLLVRIQASHLPGEFASDAWKTEKFIKA